MSYEAVFGEGFEDMQRRVPSIDKAKQLVGWAPQKTLRDILHDVALGADSEA
jgi:UDP-glucose 4-epimerase